MQECEISHELKDVVPYAMECQDNYTIVQLYIYASEVHQLTVLKFINCMLFDLSPPDSLSHLISNTMIKWAEEKHIEDPTLVREMFNLLHRQYDGVGEVRTIHAIAILATASTSFLRRWASVPFQENHTQTSSRSPFRYTGSRN